MAFSLAVFAVWQCFPTSRPSLANVEAGAADMEQTNFMTKVVGAAAQGMTAAFVAAILSAVTEPIVNRLLVKRMTFSQAFGEITFSLIVNFFFTTFPTNMLKFPVFEVITMMMQFTSLTGAVRGTVAGFLFCSIMLPVTNYRFRKSMGWEIKVPLLYQAYVPTVARDAAYGASRGVVGAWLLTQMPHETHFQKALVFGITIWASCIISSPCNEWRGFTLQPKEKRLDFRTYFKPINYARSTGIGATIMGIALMAGNLITPHAEAFFGYIKATIGVLPIAIFILVVGVIAALKK